MTPTVDGSMQDSGAMTSDVRTGAVSVTVLVLAYNHEEFLAEALDSILAQQYSASYEILIGEDCSADRTRQIADSYAAKYPDTIRLIVSDRNVGMNANLARLLDASLGSFVAICEGDDYWVDASKIERQVAELRSDDRLSMVFTDRLVKSEGAFIESKYDSRDYFESDVVAGFIPPTQTMMWRRSDELSTFIRDHPDSPSGDRMIAFHCSRRGLIRHMPFISAVYRMSGQGVWSSVSASARRRQKHSHLSDFRVTMGMPPDDYLAGALLLDALHDLRVGVRRMDALSDVVYFYAESGFIRSVSLVMRKLAGRKQR